MNKNLLLYSFLGLLVVFILTPDSPAFRQITAEDPGMFLYAGKQILAGKIPYLDFWDHKGPVIYYINALGLVTGLGRWGVLFFEFLAIFTASLLAFKLTKEAFGTIPAFFGTMAWLVSLTLVLDGGNLTEEFALPFQFLALYLFWQAEKNGLYSFRGFLIGVAAALTFLLKPNLVGVYLSIVIFLLISRILTHSTKALIFNLLTIFLGAVTIIFITFFYFWISGAFDQFLDAYFGFNFSYSTITLDIATVISRVKSILVGFWIMSRSGISFIVLTAAILGIFYLLTQREKIRSCAAIVGLVLIAVPVELALSSISGIHPAHYYIPWLPIFGILASFFAFILTKNLKLDLNLQKIFLSSLLLGMSLIPVAVWLYRIFPESNPQRCVEIAWFLAPGHYQFECSNTKSQVAEYIKSRTGKSDYVLVWGFAPSLNFYTHRPSPSRFVYQYPLFLSGYYRQDRFKKVIDEVIAKKPTLIIDASPPFYRVPPLNMLEYEKWQGVKFAQIENFFEFIDLNYRVVGKIGDDQWTIYEYIGTKKNEKI